MKTFNFIHINTAKYFNFNVDKKLQKRTCMGEEAPNYASLVLIYFESDLFLEIL